MMTRRQQLAAQAATMRAEGVIYRVIADRLGVSLGYAHQLVYDPDGAAGAARKASYAGTCVDCGAATSGSGGRRSEPRCLPCANVRSGAARTVWTREAIIDSIRCWKDEHGTPPRSTDWAASGATPPQVRRYRSLNAAGVIPHAMTAVHVFGSWNAAIAAAGFTPRLAGHQTIDRNQEAAA